MISKRYLYAMGEPLGDGATERRAGLGPRYGLGGSSSSAASAQTSNVMNTDSRQVIDTSISSTDNSTSDSRAFANSGNSNSATYNTTTDFGSVAAGADVSIAALTNNATNIDHILNLADTLFSKTKGSLDANVKLAGQLNSTAASAYSDATSQASGTKNMVMAALAVVAIVGFMAVYRK